LCLTTTPILKNNVATPDDSIYLASVRLSCYLCKKNGRPKIFKNLWALYRHFQLVHAEEYQNWLDEQNEEDD